MGFCFPAVILPLSGKGPLKNKKLDKSYLLLINHLPGCRFMEIKGLLFSKKYYKQIFDERLGVVA